MPVRAFASAESSRLLFPGTHVNYKDAVTVAALIRPGANQNLSKEAPGAAGVFEALTSGEALAGYGLWGKWGEESPAIHLETDDGSIADSQTNIGTAAENWILVVATRASGSSVKPTFYIYNPLTGAWSKAEGNKASTQPTKDTGLLDLGGGGDGYSFTGRAAAAARWNRALNEAEAHELGVRLIEWEAKEPGFFVLLDQASVTEAVKDLSGNGGNQSSRTATSVVAEEPPIPYRAPGFVGRSVTAYAARTSLSLTRPEGAKKGDLLVARVYLELTTSDIASTGWALACPKASVSTTYQQSILTRFDDGTAGPWSFAWDGTSHGCEGDVAAYRGVDPTAPIVAEQLANASAKSIKCPSVIATVDDSLVITLGVESVGQVATQPAGQIERADNEPSESGLHAADVAQPSAGASGEKTYTLGSAATSVGATLALTPLVEEEAEPVVGTRVVVNRVHRPSRLSVIVKDSKGNPITRWAQDEPKLENVFSGLTFSGEMPGGHKELSLTLHRDPKLSYRDLALFNRIEVWSSDGERVWCGTIRQEPTSDGDQQSIEVKAAGDMQFLEDDPTIVGPGFISRDLSGWASGGNIDNQISNNESSVKPNGSASVNSAGETLGATLTFDFTGAAVIPGAVQGQEMWWDGGGPPIGIVYADFHGDGSSPWFVIVGTASTGSRYIGTTTTGAYANSSAANSATQGFVFGGPQARHAFLYMYYFNSPSSEFTMTNIMYFANVVVLGEPILPLQGVWPDVGYLAKQMIPGILEGSPLTTDPDLLEDDGFVIPHAWFGSGTRMSKLVEVTKYGLLDWFVFGDRILQYRFPGTYGRTWRLGPGNGPKNSGADANQVYDRLMVSYQDVDGTTKYTDLLTTTDPSNPAAAAGVPRGKLLALNGVCTEELALEVRQRAFEELQNLSQSGEVTLTDHVQDEASGAWYPVSYVQPGDRVREQSNGHERKVTATSYADESVSNSLTIGAPPEGLGAIEARFNGRLIELGLG